MNSPIRALIILDKKKILSYNYNILPEWRNKKLKATKKMMSFIAVLALLLSTASCSLLNGGGKFNQKIVVGNIELTIREDMKEDPSITTKGQNYITCYFWNGYGMNIGSINATDIILSGKTADTFLAETLEEQKNLTDIKKYQDVSYAEYSITEGENQYLFTYFILEEGNEFYFLEFYTMSETSDEYMKQYQTIVSSVKMIKETTATVNVTIGGIAMTIDGDSVDSGNNIYKCGRYMVSAASYTVPSEYSAEEFIRSAIEQGGYKTAEGKEVTEVTTTADGISSFECYTNNMYAYHYAKTVETKIIYLFFFTTAPADEQLKTDFGYIAAAAKLS